MAFYKEIKDIEEIVDENITFDDVKNHVFARILNKDNIPFDTDINDIPYIKKLDLIITYYISYKTYIGNNSGINCYLIKNKDLESWNITEEDIKNIAFNNHKERNSIRIETVTKHAARHHVFSPIVDIPDTVLTQMSANPSGRNNVHSVFETSQYGNIPFADDIVVPSEYQSKDYNILVISNRTMNFGSIGMFTDNTLNKVYEKFQENFYILPTSVHELLCVKQSFADKNKNLKETEEDLLDMVEQINDKMLSSSDDILSYNIYYYMHNERCTLLIK